MFYVTLKREEDKIENKRWKWINFFYKNFNDYYVMIKLK